MENSLMPFLSDWNDYEQELENFLARMQHNKKKPTDPDPPQDVLALLKTADLKTALKLADTAVTRNDIDGMRKAQAKTQKFFLMYANQYRLAKKATKAKPELQALSDQLNTFNVYMTRTQVGVARKCDAMIQAAKQVETNQKKLKVLNIKSALSPLKFMYDWKAAKRDFENVTGVSKPSLKIMGEYRKSVGLDASLGEMDKACQRADPDAYRNAYAKFVIAHTNYESVLEMALVSDRAADKKYTKKVGGLKEVLNSIDNRAKEKIRLLDQLKV
jgi:hypothetical protein